MEPFLRAVAKRALDASPPLPPLLTLEALLHELGLASLGGSLSELSLDNAAQLLHNYGRPTLLASIRQAGVAAGHAQKIANGLARACRSGRVNLSDMPIKTAPVLLPTHVPDAAALRSEDSVEVALAGGDDTALLAALTAAPARGPAALVSSAASGDVLRLAMLLRARVAVDTVAPCGASPKSALLAAASRGHDGCVAMLIQHHAILDATSPSDGSTPLLTACRHGHVQVAAQLMAARADANLANRSGTTPLHASCLAGRQACTALLCAAGADVGVSRGDGSTPLMDACQQGNAACATEMLRARADPNAAMHHGWMALLVAALHGHTRCVRALCDARAAVDRTDVDGTTAICIGAQRGQGGCVEALLAAGACPAAARVDGLTPLAYAAMGGHQAVSSTLLGAGAPPDAADADGWTPLLYAAYHGHGRCVRALLTARAPADCARADGFTPLMAAAAAGHPSVLHALVDGGASLGCVKRPGSYVHDVWEHAACGAEPTACGAALAVYGTRSSATSVAAADDTGTDADDDVWLRPADPSSGSFEMVHFRPVPRLQPDESWQERPVRRLAHVADGAKCAPLAYRTNSRSPHGINIVHLVLRDHGMCRWEDGVDSPMVRCSLRTGAFFARTEAPSGVPAAAAGVDAAAGVESADEASGGRRGAQRRPISARLEPTAEWSLYWYGGPLDVRDVHSLCPHQKLSKYPGSSALTLKSELWRHFRFMQRTHGKEAFGFMPPSYTLPAEAAEWRAAMRTARAEGRSDLLWIVKPNNASRSRGIVLVSAEDANDAPVGSERRNESGVACAYIDNPCLIDGRKFDLRLYALVTSWHPLVVYLYDEGIGRFATEPYACDRSTLGRSSMHLTNFSVNRSAPRMMLSALRERLAAQLGEAAAARTWRLLDSLVIKTFLMVEAPMSNALISCSLPVACGQPNTNCFQLFGLDVLLSADGTPWCAGLRDSALLRPFYSPSIARL